MATPQWVKKLGGHAGELYVAAELSKRGVPNALLTENFSDDDIILGGKGGAEVAYIQVKSCHPDRGRSFKLHPEDSRWIRAPKNQFVVFVWLGSPGRNDPPRFWIATKREVGRKLVRHPTGTGERRLWLKAKRPEFKLDPAWENRWSLFESYFPQ